MSAKVSIWRELLVYTKQARVDEDVAPVFKLGNLARLYSQRLKQLGVEQNKCTHSAKLRNHIFFFNFPNLPSTQIWEVLCIKYALKILVMKPSVFYGQQR